MSYGTSRAGAWVVPWLAVVAVVPLSAQGPAYPELGREEEFRLAMSAGPLPLSAHADVYLMGNEGFERAVAGTNGFACLVLRSASVPTTLAPHCLSPAAVETVLPSLLREGELQARGLSADGVSAALERDWSTGVLPLPSGPAYAYMLSSGQRLGPAAGSFEPHFMLYVPYLTNAAIGGDPTTPSFPFVGPYENHPLSTVVVVMEEFVDPADVVLPTGR